LGRKNAFRPGAHQLPQTPNELVPGRVCALAPPDGTEHVVRALAIDVPVPVQLADDAPEPVEHEVSCYTTDGGFSPKPIHTIRTWLLCHYDHTYRTDTALPDGRPFRTTRSPSQTYTLQYVLPYHAGRDAMQGEI